MLNLAGVIPRIIQGPDGLQFHRCNSAPKDDRPSSTNRCRTGLAKFGARRNRQYQSNTAGAGRRLALTGKYNRNVGLPGPYWGIYRRFLRHMQNKALKRIIVSLPGFLLKDAGSVGITGLSPHAYAR